jgi:hypothetical protein
MKRFASLLVTLLVLACGGESPQPATTSSAPPAAPPPPTADQARTLIAAAPEFGDFEFTNAAFTLPLQRSAMNEPQRAAAKDLTKAGWIALDGDTLKLTAKSEHDRRFLLRPNGTLDIVPLAKKELVGVTSVAAGSEGPVVTFTWKWLPNEIGTAFQSGPVAERFAGTQTAKATLLWDASAGAWVVLRIER